MKLIASFEAVHDSSKNISSFLFSYILADLGLHCQQRETLKFKND